MNKKQSTHAVFQTATLKSNPYFWDFFNFMKTVREFCNSSWTWHLLVLHQILVSTAHAKNTTLHVDLQIWVDQQLNISFQHPYQCCLFFQSPNLSKGFYHFASKVSIQPCFKNTIQMSWYSTILHRTSPVDHHSTVFLWFMIQKN